MDYIKIPSRSNGKTMWFSSVTNFADKQPLWSIDHRYHDACEQWIESERKWPKIHSREIQVSNITTPEDVQKAFEELKKGEINLGPGKLYFKDQNTGELKEFTGVKNITPLCTMRYRGNTWTHPESIYGKQGHMAIKDFSGGAKLTPDDYIDVEVGDVMTYIDPDVPECPDSGKTFVWQGVGIGWKELAYGKSFGACYIDTDILTPKEAEYCRNDVTLQAKIMAGADLDGDTVMRIKTFEEELKMANTSESRFNAFKPGISKVIFNEPATVVFWTDGTKTVVKCGDGDYFDPEKGIAMACMKKLLGTNKTGSNYLDGVKKYIQKWEEDQEEGNVISTVIKAILNDIHLPHSVDRDTLSYVLKESCTLVAGTDINTDAMDIPEETEKPGMTDKALKEVAEGGESDAD